MDFAVEIVKAAYLFRVHLVLVIENGDYPTRRAIPTLGYTELSLMALTMFYKFDVRGNR